jgi:hypothetical protein
MKKKKSRFTAEDWARFKETERKLLERIRYHEAKLAEERGEEAKPSQ